MDQPHNISFLGDLQLKATLFTNIGIWIHHQALIYGYKSIACICNVIRQLQNSSHQLEIKVHRSACTPLEEKICQLCHQEVELEEGDSVAFLLKVLIHYAR